MPAVREHDHPDEISWRDQRRYGWIPYLPRIMASYGPSEPIDIKEEGYDPSQRPVSKLAKRSAAQPAGPGIEAMLEYVFRCILRPRHTHPLSSTLSAIEDLLGSKLFVRPTKDLPLGMAAATKFFPIACNVRRRHRVPIAFYAMIYRMLPESHGRGIELLIHRLTVAHEAMHHYLHLAPTLEPLVGDRDAFESASREYSAWLDEGKKPGLGPDPDLAELEAEVCAFLTVLEVGFTRYDPRSLQDMDRCYGDLGIDTGLLSDRIAHYAQSVARPRSLSELALDGAKPPARHGALDQISDAGLEELVMRAQLIAKLGRHRHYAWVCRAIEDRFLDRHPWYNVLVKCVSGPTAKLYCEIERQELRSVFPEVNELLTNKPHLIRYNVVFPEDWDWKDPRQRIQLLTLLGLVDLQERRHPPAHGECSPETPPESRRHFLDDYDPSAVEQATRYAIVIDAFTGDPDEREVFTRPHAQAMLTDAVVGWDDLMQRQPTRDRLITLTEEPLLTDYRSELDRFRSMLPELLATHRNRFVAILHGQVVDEDDDEFTLASRAYERYPGRYVLVHRVEPRAEQHALFDTPTVVDPAG